MVNMTDEEYLRIASFLKKHYGIDMSQKKDIIAGRMEKHIKEIGWKTYTELMDAAEWDFSGIIEKELVNLLSTNHTFFMREPEHFNYLSQVVLPWVKEKAKRTKMVRIWSGASSTGEEPYTIAMVMDDFFGLEYDEWDAKVLATDISTDVLQTAMEGVYSAEQVEVLSENWRNKFFHRFADDSAYCITDELKSKVAFRKFNLMDAFAFREKFQVIFLRNVMIYFDEKTKKELIQKVYDVLEPGGYLFVGQTEEINDENGLFEQVRPSVYRKREGEQIRNA